MAGLSFLDVVSLLALVIAVPPSLLALNELAARWIPGRRPQNHTAKAIAPHQYLPQDTQPNTTRGFGQPATDIESSSFVHHAEHHNPSTPRPSSRHSFVHQVAHHNPSTPRPSSRHCSFVHHVEHQNPSSTRSPSSRHCSSCSCSFGRPIHDSASLPLSEEPSTLNDTGVVVLQRASIGSRRELHQSTAVTGDHASLES